MHTIFLAVQEELESLDTVNLLNSLITSLQNQVNQPQQPNFQKEVSEHLITIKTTLTDSPSDTFSPAWRKVLEELQFDDYLGTYLLTKINNVFTRNEITPSVALDELSEIFARLSEIDQSLKKILEGFSTLDIGEDELQPGECEVGVLIPRDAFNNNIEDLSKELKEINFIFGTFEEIATGKRGGLKLRDLSSSDPSFFFDVLPKVAAFTAVAVERLIASYKQILEIRKLKMELQKQKVPTESLKGIEDPANTVLEKGIKKLMPELTGEFGVTEDRGRKNELKSALKISLNKLANRIDKGFNIEVRAAPHKEAEEENSEDSKEDIKNISLVLEKAEVLRFIKTSGDPILSLPEANGIPIVEVKPRKVADIKQTLKDKKKTQKGKEKLRQQNRTSI